MNLKSLKEGAPFSYDDAWMEEMLPNAETADSRTSYSYRKSNDISRCNKYYYGYEIYNVNIIGIIMQIQRCMSNK